MIARGVLRFRPFKSQCFFEDSALMGRLDQKRRRRAGMQAKAMVGIAAFQASGVDTANPQQVIPIGQIRPANRRRWRYAIEQQAFEPIIRCV